MAQDRTGHRRERPMPEANRLRDGGAAYRWAVAAIGTALVVTAVRSPHADHATSNAVHVPLAILLAMGVVAVGVGLARSPVSDRATLLAAGWTIGGALAMAAAGTWTLAIHPVDARMARTILGFDLITGGLAGSLVGLTYARSRYRAHQLAEEQERLSFLNYLLRHNVLNGVQVVKGQAASLRNTVPADAEIRVDVIESWTDGLGELVGRLRQLLDASAGTRSLERVHLGTVLDTEVTKVQGAFDASITTTDTAATVRADDGLHQVFECLLIDAVERSEASAPTVDVATTRTGSDVLVEVSSPDPVASTDGGTNFAPATDSDPAGDLGFGRYLVATLIDYYGGSITMGGSDDDTLYSIRLPHTNP